MYLMVIRPQSKRAKEHKNLIDQGYNLSSANINPINNNSGNFEMDYKKSNGDSAMIKGSMEDGKVENLQKLTQEDKDRLMRQLKQDNDFKRLNNNLQKKGFKQSNAEFSLGENKTSIKVNYKNEQNQTTAISAELINGTIQNVKIENPEQEDSHKDYLWIWIILVFIILVLSYYIYNRYFAKKKTIFPEIKPKIAEKPFDYKKGARKLLEKSKILFTEGEYKDAYEKAGQALRLYLSYKYGLKKETTNDEIIKFLKEKKIDSKNIKECFNLCSLVEFAKYKESKKDFGKIIEIIKGIVG